ncbi:hypothetical protein F1880_001889 [Penicillium rolfsii]|nr:hypothetical protein F1880_001889 [Penicillium rolfsii]
MALIESYTLLSKVVNSDQTIPAVEVCHEKFGLIDAVSNNAGYANTYWFAPCKLQQPLWA